MKLERTTDAINPAVADALVEQQLYIDSGESPLVIANAVASATDRVENDTDRALITQSWTMTLDSFPFDTIFIPKGKIQSITTFTYIDGDGDVIPMVEDTDYTLTTVGSEQRITSIDGFPGTITDQKDVITLVWVTGYGLNDTDIPGWAQRAILLKCQEAYDRTDVEQAYQATINANKLFFEYSINDVNNGRTVFRFPHV